MRRLFHRATLAFLLACYGAVASMAKEPVRKEPPMDFLVLRDSQERYEPNCPQWIAAEGQIMPETANKLETFLQVPARRKLPLVLNSGGGSIQAAVAMGRLLRKYRMDTAVGRSSVMSCTAENRASGKCKPSPVLQAFDGTAFAGQAYCGSACPLVLLGGMHRIVDPHSFIGLHKPVGSIQPYVDQYLIRYRLENGKKQELSRTFVKRIYKEEQTVVGITPRLRVELVKFLNEMGGSLEILDQMEKASPKEMNWISYASRDRERLGLVTANFRPLDSLVGLEMCADKRNRPAHCIHLKAKEPFVMRPFDR